MKKVICLVFPLAFLLFALAACNDEKGQTIELPQTIKNYLAANFPNAEIEESEQSSLCTGDAVYEVELEVANDEDINLTFDMEGNLLFTETEIPAGELPAAVTATIASKYADYAVNEAERLDHADKSVQFEVELKKGKTTLSVLFNTSGEALCEEQDDDE